MGVREDVTTTVTEHDGKHHARRLLRSPRQASRDQPGETTTPNPNLPRRGAIGPIPADLVTGAQRTVGNAGVQRLLRNRILRTESAAERSDETYESSAERAAAAATPAPVRDPTPAVHRRDASAVVQRDPDTKTADAGAKAANAGAKTANAGDGTFRFENQGYVFSGVESDGVRLLVGVPTADERKMQAAIPAIAKRIAADNALIKDPAFRVETCIITNTSSRLALWKGRPTVLINRVEANEEAVAHEMGHALFYYLEQRAQSKEPDAKQAANFRVQVADIFNRLAATKTVAKKVHTREDGKVKPEERDEPAGLWIVDPSQWKSGKQPLREHPWDDPDEFFGSAAEAYQIDRKGLERAIARFTKIDPAVEAPMKELIALLDAFFTKSGLPTDALAGKPAGKDAAAREAAAAQALKGVKSPSNVEGAPEVEVQTLIAPH